MVKRGKLWSTLIFPFIFPTHFRSFNISQGVWQKFWKSLVCYPIRFLKHFDHRRVRQRDIPFIQPGAYMLKTIIPNSNFNSDYVAVFTSFTIFSIFLVPTFILFSVDNEHRDCWLKLLQQRKLFLFWLDLLQFPGGCFFICRLEHAD